MRTDNDLFRLKRDDELMKSITTMIPDGESGDITIDTVTLSKQQVDGCKIRDMYQGNNEFEDLKPGDYKRMLVKGSCSLETVMSNTPMEMKTNYDVIRKSNGNVLIAGLGLGMILLPILDREWVKHVTVVEKNPNVIKLIKPLIHPEKCTIFNQDIHQFKSSMRYDVIYFDIWNNICGVNWIEMKALNKKFKYKLNRNNPNCWMGSWRQKDCQRLFRSEYQ